MNVESLSGAKFNCDECSHAVGECIVIRFLNADINIYLCLNCAEEVGRKIIAILMDNQPDPFESVSDVSTRW